MANHYVERENEQMRRYRMEFFSIRAKEKTAAFAHLHPAVELLYIREGSCRVTLDGRSYRAVQGDLVFCRSNVIHSIHAEGSVVYDVLKLHSSLIFEIFSGENFRTLFFLTNRPDFSCLFPLDTPQGIEIAALLERIRAVAGEKKPFSLLLMRSLAAQLVILLSGYFHATGEERDSIPANILQSINAAIEYADANFASPITPADCAALAHMSYSYFARCFRLVTGKSFKKYLADIRLSRAEYMLLSGDQPVTEVALACGYENVSYFIREFRKYKQQTPRAFRRACRQSRAQTDPTQ